MRNGNIRTYLIGYDIADPLRLKKVHRLLSEEAIPIQYSVFLTRRAGRSMGYLSVEIAALINWREDDVRIYQVPRDPEFRTLGRAPLPEGIAILDGHDIVV